MKELIKNALILCAITITAGILLGAVYEITKKPREEQAEKKQLNAYKAVISQADEFVSLDLDTDALYEYLKDADITQTNVLVEGCVEAFDGDGKSVGYIVSVTSKEGYAGNISFSVGFDSEGNVTGVSVTSISETAGLGMNAKEESFLTQYEEDGEGLFVVNKDDSAKGINIDALSGATITSKAMTKGVNAAKLTAQFIMEDTSGDREKESIEGGEDNE